MSEAPRRIGKHYVAFGEMVWPLPEGDVGYALRYSEALEKPTLLVAASVQDAYAALIGMSARNRNEVIRSIRDGMKQATCANCGEQARAHGVSCRKPAATPSGKPSVSDSFRDEERGGK